MFGGFGGFGGFGVQGQGGMSQAQPPMGGFFLSPPNEQQNEGGLRARKSEATSRDAQGFMPVTVKQIKLSSADAEDSIGAPLRVCGREVACVELVGVLLELHSEDLTMRYVLSDGTGVITVKRYMDDEPREQLVAGRYVRVVGPLRRFGNDVIISAHRVIGLSSLDEIARHMVAVMYNVAQLERGDSDGRGKESFQAEILRIFGPKGPRYQPSTGVSRDTLRSHFGGNPVDVDLKIKELIDLGLLYSTFDDNHFQISA